jgi:ABC-type sugar transport system substrate-binding protein
LLEGRWTESSGEEAVSSWLSLKSSEVTQLALVGCQNDAMAVGAARALAARRDRRDLTRVPITGCDGLPAGGRRLVDEGQLAATVVVASNTGPAIRLVAQCLATGRPAPAETLLPVESYPSETVLRLRTRTTT